MRGSLPSPIRLAVVDDAEVSRVLVERVALRHCGDRLGAVLHGQDGFDALVLRFSDDPPHLMFIDGSMHRLVGPAAIAEIRRREGERGLPRLPLVILSGDPFHLEAGMAAGADAQLEKPWAIDDLRVLIDRLLAR